MFLIVTAMCRIQPNCVKSTSSCWRNDRATLVKRRVSLPMRMMKRVWCYCLLPFLRRQGSQLCTWFREAVQRCICFFLFFFICRNWSKRKRSRLKLATHMRSTRRSWKKSERIGMLSKALWGPLDEMPMRRKRLPRRRMISLIQTMVCSLFSFDEDVDINDDFFLTSKTSVLSLSVCVHDVEQAREEEGQEGQEGRYSSPHSIEFYRIRGGQEETSSVGVDAHECMCFLSPFMS